MKAMLRKIGYTLSLLVMLMMSMNVAYAAACSYTINLVTSGWQSPPYPACAAASNNVSTTSGGVITENEVWAATSCVTNTDKSQTCQQESMNAVGGGSYAYSTCTIEYCTIAAPPPPPPAAAHTTVSGLAALGLNAAVTQVKKNTAVKETGYVYAAGTNVATVTVGSGTSGGSYLGTIQVIPTSGKQCVTGTSPRSTLSLSNIGSDGSSDAITNMTLSQVNKSSAPTAFTNVPTAVTVSGSNGYAIYYNLEVNMGTVAYTSSKTSTVAIAWVIYCDPGFTASYPTPTTSSTPLSITGWTSTTN